MSVPCVRVKPGVEFTVIAPGGFHILAGLDATAAFITHDITITSACEGVHSGPNDPHPQGKAYDIRTYDLPDKHAMLKTLMGFLGEDNFYCFLEDPDGPNEHVHAQVRHGVSYP